MAVFFTADTHFGDHRTINIHRRPFESAGLMDEALIRNWNEAIGPQDEVWHLGDFCRKASDAEAYLERLNGHKHLICGNNDPATLRDLPGWASVHDYHEMTVQGRLIVLCHYPFRSWNGQHKRSINLHGHSHGKMKPILRQLDVGVDAVDFRPIALEAIFERPGFA
ncbi:metallophosphoesterase [Altererythrobacter sp. SALINAS58]|uniref:metallophosphoesterase family protein n=1 Tax=Alteripontixanthobacter muriae TaxID=2705546 RepID=UPI0015772744|nr:metallophosphoesterase [Alteripontixanthobacter muriae]